jgi:NitT/TauT family transport system ATP-binding protein
LGNLIEIKGVTHAYKTKAGPFPVLRDLNISIPEGSFCAVVGPSGLRQVHADAADCGPDVPG